MEKEISKPRAVPKASHPRIGVIQIEKGAVGKVIGPMGATIKGIQAETGKGPGPRKALSTRASDFSRLVHLGFKGGSHRTESIAPLLLPPPTILAMLKVWSPWGLRVTRRPL